MKSKMPTIVAVEYHYMSLACQAWSAWSCQVRTTRGAAEGVRVLFLTSDVPISASQKSALSPLKRHFILTPAYGQMGTFAGFEVDFMRLEG